MIPLARIINCHGREGFSRSLSRLLCGGKICQDDIMISRAKANTVASIPGNIRGSALLSDVENIRHRLGDEGLRKFQIAMEELGYPIEYGRFKAMEWYPMGLRALSFAVLEDVFGWKDDDIRDLGYHAPKYSFIVKFMMKFFTSPEAAFSKAPEYWEKYYSVGTLEIGKYDEKAREVTLIIREFKTIPLYCRYLEGFFRRLMQYLRPTDDVQCKEVRCELEGEPYHEFRIYW